MTMFGLNTSANSNNYMCLETGHPTDSIYRTNFCANSSVLAAGDQLSYATLGDTVYQPTSSTSLFSSYGHSVVPASSYCTAQPSSRFQSLDGDTCDLSYYNRPIQLGEQSRPWMPRQLSPPAVRRDPELQSRSRASSFGARTANTPATTVDSYSSGGVSLNDFSGSMKEEYSDPSDYSSDTCSDADWSNRSNLTSLNGSPRTGIEGHMNDMTPRSRVDMLRHRRGANGKMTPEEDERRRIRRERNKLAAARCRQRRVDLTNQLLAETECLEDEKLKLEKEISNLQRQRTQLEFVLEAHSSRCCHVNQSPMFRNNHNDLSTLPIKVETVDEHFPARTRPDTTRPSSLAINMNMINCSASGATPLTFNSLGLDCMVDGHTGLTPITGPPATNVDNRLITGDVMTSGGLSPTTLMTL